VADAALAAGASVINDVSCLGDDALARVAAARGAHLIVMHSRGAMATMPGFSAYPAAAYEDPVTDVARALGEALDRAERAGLPRDRMLIDPGLGFHKNASHSYALLARLRELASLGAPIVVGASRKSFLARDVAAPPESRLGGTIAACLAAADNGAACVRVHDVRAVRQALAVHYAIRVGGSARRV
jgi:dihydropteroate synthase